MTIRCENCDVALVLHGDGTLRCHHCGWSEPAPELCPACRSAELARIGAGTQRLERELASAIPDLALFRLDADTVEHRGVADTLRAFADAKGAALIGTQMVAKGHHFAGVALAAVVDADTGLGLPDFRAEERTFQLLTQLAGRSGREAPGRVLVQTFQPDARAIELAARHDVAGFLAGELERRRELGYPPFRHLVRIVVAGAEAGRAEQVLAELKAGLPGRRPRAGAAAASARPLPRAARREDRPAAGGRLDRGAPARRSGAGDATARIHGGRRRRSTEPLTYTSRMEEDVEGEVAEDSAELDAETQARRQLALAQVRQYGDPVLRMRAREVTSFDEDLERLARA